MIKIIINIDSYEFLIFDRERYDEMYDVFPFWLGKK